MDSNYFKQPFNPDFARMAAKENLTKIFRNGGVISKMGHAISLYIKICIEVSI